MLSFINLCAIAFLLVLAYQDFKYRKIHWWLIPVLLVLFYIRNLWQTTINYLLESFVFNLSFVLIQLFLLVVYMSMKNKKLTNVVNSYIGLGDILFFVVMCMAFSFINFVFVYVIGLMLSLIITLAYRILKIEVSKEIPLAGILSFMLATLLLLNVSFPDLNFYNHEWIKKWILL